jgi:formate-dependent nitrite reductase membrane component NrfD
VAIDLFLSGMGAGLYLISQIVGFALGSALGIALVVIGSLILTRELARPQQMWRSFSRAATAWMSRGAIVVFLFIALGVLDLAPNVLGGLPWATGTALGYVAAFLAVIIVLYPGFLFASSPAIPFWNTPLLPLLFGTYALLGGVAALFIMLSAPAARVLPGIDTLPALGLWVLLPTAILMLIYLVVMHNGGIAAQEAVRILTRGRLALLFLLGVAGAGLIIPAALLIAVYLGGASPAAPLLFISGVFILGGGLLMRYCLLRAGVYGPLI